VLNVAAKTADKVEDLMGIDLTDPNLVKKNKEEIQQIGKNAAELGNLVADINNAGILGVSATNDAGKLRLDSDITVAKDQLRIVSGVRQPGSDGVLADAELIVFAFMQIIINPYGNPGEYFGRTVLFSIVFPSRTGVILR
jgi:hypothetical protein